MNPESQDLTGLDITALSPLIQSKAVSPVEVVEAYLARIEHFNPHYRAYISIYPEQALEAARQAETDIAKGQYRGPLHGVPVGIKDLFQVEGMSRTCGSEINVMPDSEATSVTRLRAAGAIVLGMLNLHEFAFGPTGINLKTGTARNPWDPDRICGGSSSGAGCAVAGGLAAGALGSDTGGSIRIPAALCAVTGLKQTYGLASRHGIYPLSGQMDHGGPLARSVRDAALLLAAIAGEDPRDPTTLGAKAVDYAGGLDESTNGGLAGLRIGVPANFFFDGLHPDVDAAVKTAIGRLAELGASVSEITLPFMDEIAPAWDAIGLTEAHHVHREHLDDHGHLFSPDVRERLLRALEVTAQDFLQAHDTRTRIIKEMDGILAGVDLIAMPATPIPAVPIESGTIQIGGETVEGWRVLGRLTRLASLTGQPAISVPCGFTGEGLPVGLQLLGRPYGEPLLLRAAHAYEQACEWSARRPELVI